MLIKNCFSKGFLYFPIKCLCLINLIKTVIQITFLCGHCYKNASDEVNKFERNVLLIFGPFNENYSWGIRTTSELKELIK